MRTGSVQARYTHITPVTRRRLLAGLTELSEASLDTRMQLAERSPVSVPDRLFAERNWSGCLGGLR
jgi:hypothetical protein